LTYFNIVIEKTNMSRRLLVILLSIAVLLSLSISCSATEPVTDFDDLTERISQTGVTVEVTSDDVRNIHLSVPGLVIEVGDEEVWVFEYEEIGQADTEYKALTGSGPGLVFFEVDEAEGSVEVIPRDRNCYHSGRFIIIYDGEDETVLDTLKEAVGKPLPQ
jgi:hypothetical protein